MPAFIMLVVNHERSLLSRGSKQKLALLESPTSWLLFRLRVFVPYYCHCKEPLQTTPDSLFIIGQVVQSRDARTKITAFKATQRAVLKASVTTCPITGSLLFNYIFVILHLYCITYLLHYSLVALLACCITCLLHLMISRCCFSLKRPTIQLKYSSRTTNRVICCITSLLHYLLIA